LIAHADRAGRNKNLEVVDMPKIFLALLLGLAAGLLDVAPMVAHKMNPYACWSAFLHYLVFGIVVAYVPWDMAGWLKGLLLGILLAVPVVVMVSKDDPKSGIPILAMAVVLGSLVGWASGRFIR
jgi:hypothetical protein